MGFGSTVRRRLGAYEAPISELYRSYFINLDDFAELVQSMAPAQRILEIGCGDGSLVARLAECYPVAEILGIDVSPEPGRLFTGDRSRVSFRSIHTGDLLEEGPAPFDLVVICDVLHHVPPPERPAILADSRRLLAPGGMLVLKDWEPSRSLAHGLAKFSDTYISGDTVAFPPKEELRALVQAALPDDEVLGVARVPPHRNNYALFVRRSG